MKYPINEIYDWPIIPKVVAIALACLIILFFGYYFDFSDSIAKKERLAKQEQDLLIQYESAASSVNNLKAELTKYTLLLNAIEASQKNIITPSELPELLNEILKIGRQNELEFNQFNPGPEIKEGTYIKVVIKTVIVGTYDQIANFMSQVANMNKTVGIGNFVISKILPASPTDESVLNNRLTSELMLEVYEVKK